MGLFYYSSKKKKNNDCPLFSNKRCKKNAHERIRQKIERIVYGFSTPNLYT